MTWNLIEALTGFWTGDDWFLNGRKENVVSTKTHYPHQEGQKVPFEADIQRALILIRHPMDAIPSYHNYCYEIENSFKRHTTRAPVDAWIPWRDKHFEKELNTWKDTIIYWMDTFSPSDRLVIFYEDIVEQHTGPLETFKLSKFLARTENVQSVGKERAACVWHAIVKYHEHSAEQNNIENNENTETAIPLNKPVLGGADNYHEHIAEQNNIENENTETLTPWNRPMFGGIYIPRPLNKRSLRQLDDSPLPEQLNGNEASLLQEKAIDYSPLFTVKATDYLQPISPIEQQSELGAPILEQAMPDGSPSSDRQLEPETLITEQVQPYGSLPLEQQSDLETPILQQIQLDSSPHVEQQHELETPVLQQVQPDDLPPLDQQQELETLITEQVQPNGAIPLERHSELETPILQQVQSDLSPPLEQELGNIPQQVQPDHLSFEQGHETPIPVQETPSYQPNPASFRSGPTDKPFTLEQHEQIVSVLRELQERYKESELKMMFHIYISRVFHSRK